MNLVESNFHEYFKLQKLTMSNWRIVDIDHYMKGNSFFNKLVDQLDWHNGVEKLVGTPDKRRRVVRDVAEVKQVKDATDIYEKYINMKEPRSNRGLEIFKGKEELEAEKKLAK